MIRCCDMIPQMNHWFRDKSKHFCCAAAGHQYQPWGGNNAKPGYVLCLYGDGGVHYIRAEVPQPVAAGKLALLKLMLAEKNLLSIVHDERSYTNFWKHINQICDQEFSMIAKSCPTVYVKVQARQRTSNANNDSNVVLLQNQVGFPTSSSHVLLYQHLNLTPFQPFALLSDAHLLRSLTSRWWRRRPR